MTATSLRPDWNASFSAMFTWRGRRVARTWAPCQQQRWCAANATSQVGCSYASSNAAVQPMRHHRLVVGGFAERRGGCHQSPHHSVMLRLTHTARIRRVCMDASGLLRGKRSRRSHALRPLRPSPLPGSPGRAAHPGCARGTNTSRPGCAPCASGGLQTRSRSGAPARLRAVPCRHGSMLLTATLAVADYNPQWSCCSQQACLTVGSLAPVRGRRAAGERERGAAGEVEQNAQTRAHPRARPPP